MKKVTDKPRRLFLNGIWATPVVVAVSLPAHAQMSVCSMTDFVGRWRFSGSTTTITLFADGTTTNSASRWSVSSGEFRLTSDFSDVVFVAPVTTNCDELVGTQTVNTMDPPIVTNETLQRVT